MAVKSFMTNNLVKEHDIYVNFMKHRNDEITNGGDEPTDILFYKDCLLGASSDAMRDSYIAICKWHCITITYDIWSSILGQFYDVKNTTNISYKTLFDVPEDIIRKFKYRVEQTIKNAGCDYNSKRGFKAKVYDACRYLAMFWTYLDIIKDEKTQRFFPTIETAKRAAKIFGYPEGDNPFYMNGKFYNRKIDKIESGSSIVSEVDPYDIKIEDMMLTTRTYMCLKRTQHKTLGDILEMTIKDLIHVRNFGLRSLREVIETLNKYGYSYPINPDADPDAGPLKAYITTATPIKAVVADIKKPEKKLEKKVIEIEKRSTEELEEKYSQLLVQTKNVHDRNKELVVKNGALEEEVESLKRQKELLLDDCDRLRSRIDELKNEKLGLTEIIDLLIKRCKAERIPNFSMKYNNWNISIGFDGSFLTIDSGDECKGWTIRTTKEDK